MPHPSDTTEIAERPDELTDDSKEKPENSAFAKPDPEHTWHFRFGPPLPPGDTAIVSYPATNFLVHWFSLKTWLRLTIPWSIPNQWGTRHHRGWYQEPPAPACISGDRQRLRTGTGMTMTSHPNRDLAHGCANGGIEWNRVLSNVDTSW